MKIPLVIAGMVAAGLLAGGVLVLAAEAETNTSSTPQATAPLRTVSVEGVATQAVSSTASAEAANGAYRQAMAAAIADGQGKAQYLAEKAGATLGAVQSIGEGGGYIGCPNGVEYEGVQPDFGSNRPVFAAESAPAAKGAPTPLVHKVTKHHRRRHSARRAAVESCTLSTDVALVYQMG
jgi:hypothetical protein